jgi:hypothetical protein
VYRIDYLQRKLAIQTHQLFDWGLSDEDTDRRFEGLNLDSLVKFYQQRHDIVHRDDTPISTYEELDVISVFFLNVGSRLAMMIHKKHGHRIGYLHVGKSKYKIQCTQDAVRHWLLAGRRCHRESTSGSDRVLSR